MLAGISPILGGAFVPFHSMDIFPMSVRFSSAPYLYLGCLVILLGLACTSSPAADPPPQNAKAWISAAIEAHGGPAYNRIAVAFDFRDIHYTAEIRDGAFQYTREFVKEDQTIKDVLDNERFIRRINGVPTTLPDSMAAKYSASVNSVWYFALLPSGLESPAILLNDLGQTTLRGASYQKIEVRFKEEGGGEDFEDVFVYWINKESYQVDYLAYSYNEEDGIGLRLRVATNPREIGGIRWQDYQNFKADPANWTVQQLDEALEADKLDLLSQIELENIIVARLE